ncbi:hypothetical protein EPUS_00513 [Endocarpon pusillum Z07020]|uniref:FAD synthase n=1 Tax=Endocarpon pusillum (strain Z07020 / HMAS-L-300199) TaxID=1263415 RepID=U1HQY9_ENDPU|nr:uncharacterized protein EPUS_00513 [Endocarpon pusillum Z07020]ERF71524.1 hypothetical protein EPUS_00513 [Endocarpon pusillum Z07020]
MSDDASLPPNAPMINGPGSRPQIDGEEDASPSSTTAPASVPSLEAVCADLHGRVSAFLNKTPDSDSTRRVQEQVRISIGVIEKALTDYEFSSLSLSYNGGKDCLVLLILYLYSLYSHFRPSAKLTASSNNNNNNMTTTSTPPPSIPFPTSIPAIYAQSPDPFPAMDNFVTTSSQRYHLDLCTIRTNPRPGQHSHTHVHQSLKPSPLSHSDPPLPSTPPPPVDATKRVTIRDAFATYLSASSSNDASSTRPLPNKILAIFVGTRRTDPHGSNLTHFDRTDHGWPDFMRIPPVIDWRLSEIWLFLRAEELKEADGKPLEYCEMYDEGYTSLGGVGDTVRNPRLRYVDEDGRERYRPAYQLTEDGDERLGRG